MRTRWVALGFLVVSCAPAAVPTDPRPDPPPAPPPSAAPAVPEPPTAKAPAAALDIAEPVPSATPPAIPLPTAVAPNPPLPTTARGASGEAAAPPPPVPRVPVFNAKIKAKPVKTLAPAPDDPVGGKFTLADATKGMPPKGTLVADIDTSFGVVSCHLLASQAPRNVANFVGLARGLRPFKDPRTNTWTARPAYDGTVFHRVIANFMIQGGDPTGTGRGEPGYVVPDEIWAGGAHDQPGLLCAANRGPDTNGMQFFITDGVAPHIDNGFTIFGVCAPVEIVHQIATTPKDQTDRPRSPVIINAVTIRRTAVPPGTSN